jgi:hypothetical protein
VSREVSKARTAYVQEGVEGERQVQRGEAAKAASAKDGVLFKAYMRGSRVLFLFHLFSIGVCK